MLRDRRVDRLRLLRRLALVMAPAAVFAVAGASPALAVILPPTTIDGPSPVVLEFGGVAMASDGTGGLVYTKQVEGAAHVFVARYNGNVWSPPVRVDWGDKFEASEPCISAGRNGRLLVAWTTPVAAVKGKIRRGLLAASLGPDADEFSPATVVDPNVGEEAGVAPALAGVSTGKATIAYRVITENFSVATTHIGVQLHPGDVLAEIRVARLNGDRWSRLGAINRNVAASMRPPSRWNGPQVAIGATGNAVVAWQEPDQTGAARIWVRRIFSSSIGPPILAGPATWEGKPVSGEASSFSLGVTRFDQARVVSRVEGASGEPTRLFLGTLEPNYKEGGSNLDGPQLIAGSASVVPGVAAVAAGGTGGGEGEMRIAFASGSAITQLSGDGHGGFTPGASLGDPPPAGGGEVVTTVGAEGGGVTAYESIDANGLPAIAVRQEFPDGSAQSGVIEGDVEGPVAQLAAANTEAGDALIGFRQGEAGSFEIVGDRVSAPPVSFSLEVPTKWVKPRKALVRWEAALSTVGGVSYAVVVNGRTVGKQINRRRFKPRAALLGNGIAQVEVIATDELGGQVVSRAAELKVDGEPPLATARTHGLAVTIKLSDADSGVARASCLFGEGSKPVRSLRICRHRYPHPGSHTVLVRERDRAGNAIVRHLRVRVK
jgi:hypothetical protein